MKVVICGGGVVGTCVAYFLAENGIFATVIERSTVGCAASGKAGGFLARDWCGENEALGNLASASFDLHQDLSIKLNGEINYDYRRLTAYSLKLSKNALSFGIEPNSWLDGSSVIASSLNLIGSPSSTAQLHPYKFVKTLMKFNKDHGVNLIENEEVCGITFNTDKTRVTGVSLSSGSIIECDIVVIAMGPWSGLASKWFPGVPSFYGQKAHSITIQPSAPIPAEAVFTEYGEFSPELYPRPDGEVYICGMAENPKPSDLLSLSHNVIKSDGACEKIKEICDEVSTKIKNGNVTCSQACYLPLTHDGLPLIGPIPNVHGLHIAAGHGCWGILNAPATGKALAYLILKSRSDIDIDAFNPARFSY